MSKILEALKIYEQCSECKGYNVDIEVKESGTYYECLDCGWTKFVPSK